MNKEEIKVLNLYAGIGGNRKLWTDVDVTAVEIEPKIAEIYQDFFPDDKVIVGDAHQFLLEHFDEFDFIWSSPPCPSHSRIRNIAGVGRKQNKPIYPDMKLYEEIIFLNQVSHSSGTSFKKNPWVVENVISYYKPLIKPQIVCNHYFWSNFIISSIKIQGRGISKLIKDMEKIKGFKADNSPIRKDTFLRNCVIPELGLHIFNCAFRDKQRTIREVI